jgi:hypothetical protein
MSSAPIKPSDPIASANQVERLTDRSPRASPYNARLELRDHQQAMLARCMRIEELAIANAGPLPDNPTVGLLADKPGSGKTFVILSLAMMDRQRGKGARGGGQGQGGAPPGGPNVIVVPHAIHGQWTDAVTRLCGSALTVRSFVEYADSAALYHNAAPLLRQDLVITTPLYFNVVADAMREAGIRARRVVIDEVDNGVDELIRADLPCDFKWLVSASYLVRARAPPAEASGFRRWFQPKAKREADAVYADAVCLCQDAFVDRCFPLEPPLLRAVECRSLPLERLAGVLDDADMRAANALDPGAVRLRNVETVALDEAALLRNVTDDLAQTAEAERARMAYNVELVNPDKPMTDAEAVVLENVRAERRRQREQSEERLEAAEAKLRRICERHIDPEPAKADKLGALRDMFERGADVKDGGSLGTDVLVFSSNGGGFARLRAMLRETGVEHEELDGGTMHAVDAAIAKFKRAGVDAARRSRRVLLVDPELHGCGLNLENTTDVIFLHRMAAVLYEQLVGRAQRPGRRSQLRVHQLLYAHEGENGSVFKP